MARRSRAEQRNAGGAMVPVSADNFFELFGLGSYGLSASGVSVTTNSALGVPAIWAAVNFLSGTLASLPLHLYRRTRKGRTKVKGPLADLLHDAVNDETTSYAWRKLIWSQVMTGGRAVTFIERNAARGVLNFWPLDPSGVTVKREEGRKIYSYRDGSRTVSYAASEVIDLPFMLKENGVDHRGPIAANKDVIGMAIAATQYASKFFQGGGVPPFAITGKFATPAGLQRAAEDLRGAVLKAAKEQRQALVLPEGLEIKPIGADPEKAQLIEVHRFLIEQIARIYSLPPLFLQDLSRLTYSNAEQQDLHLVKHTLMGWVDQFEKELNLKLFGRQPGALYVEANLDGMLRGDFKTRMEGYATAIQHGVLQPNEARRMENREDAEGGDRLFMQGAMMPLPQLGTAPSTAPVTGDQTDAA